MEMRGFNRDYRTGRRVQTALEPGGPVSYRDVRLDPKRKTITLARPLILDLGAVANEAWPLISPPEGFRPSAISPSMPAAISISAGATRTESRGRWAYAIRAATTN